MEDSWIRPEEWDKERSKVGVLARKLDGKGREDKSEVAPFGHAP